MRVVLAGLALAAWLAASGSASALTVQEAVLRAKPAVALITAEVRADVTMNCGRGPVTVNPAPFVETGTGWFIDGRGYLITNAHVVDPAHRLPAWVTHELKKKAIEQACVEPVLREQGLARGQRPDVEDRLRRVATERALETATLTPQPKITVLLSNGETLPAQILKFSPPLLLDVTGKPVKDAGRDLALLRVPEGVYPALAPATREPKIGDPVHILGFPGVVLSHELLNKSVTLEAVVTNGAVSGLGLMDAIGQDVIQTDAPAAHGNSGGPAITDDATVTGVMTFVSVSATGALVQGYNFLIPAKDVRAFVAGTDVKPGASQFNAAWVAGLQALFGERYAAALAHLKEANRLRPNLADVRRQLAEAERLVKNPPPRPFPWIWVALGVTLVSGGVFGGMFTRRWLKNRYRILPTQVIGLIERGLNPVMLDVRTQSDFETSPLKLPGAVRVDPAEAQGGRLPMELEKDQMVVTYCTSPEEATSARVAALMRQKGWRNVRILKGGLGGWTNARLPVESKGHLPSIGLEIYKNLTVGDVARKQFKTGEVIFREGDDPRGEAYLIHEGTVEIRKRINGTERVVNKMGEGELLGELALFRRTARSADAVATSDVELLVIQNERLEWLIRNRPQLTIEILKRLAEWVVISDKDRSGEK
jgi:S1-C subfamily serine protease/rhodanese-related sulfurtransferase